MLFFFFSDFVKSIESFSHFHSYSSTFLMSDIEWPLFTPENVMDFVKSALKNRDLKGHSEKCGGQKERPVSIESQEVGGQHG